MGENIRWKRGEEAVQRKTMVIGVAAVVLTLCVIATLTVIFYRLSEFAPDTEWKNVIPLTPMATAEVSQRQIHQRTDLVTPKGYRDNNDSTSAVWRNSRQVDIFRAGYHHAQDVMTVQAHNGEKVIAPGTSDRFVFTLENTSDRMMAYEMTLSTAVVGTEWTIPIQVRMWNGKGDYLIGSQNEYVPIAELNGMQRNGRLAAGYGAVYTIEWEWPLEGNDAYDTMLGNLAVGQDLIQRIQIDTTAWQSEPEQDGRIIEDAGLPPQTGDPSMTAWPVWLLTAVASLVIILRVLPKLFSRNKEP